MFCPFCGEKITDESVFCPNCGMKMPAAAKPAEPAPVKPLTAPVQPAPAPRKVDADAPVITRRPRPEPVHEEPVTAQPAAPVVPAYEEPVIKEPTHTARPAAPAKEPEFVYEEPVTAKAETEELAPADYTTVNVILLVVSLLSCCTCVSIPALITSIIGVVSGSACKKAIAAGDMALAAKKSKTAKTMWTISAVILVISILLALVVLLLSFLGNSGGFVNDLINEFSW